MVALHREMRGRSSRLERVTGGLFVCVAVSQSPRAAWCADGSDAFPVDAVDRQFIGSDLTVLVEDGQEACARRSRNLLVLSGVGIIGVYVPFFIKSDPTPISDRQRMADAFNEKRREALGLPDDLSGFKSGIDFGQLASPARGRALAARCGGSVLLGRARCRPVDSPAVVSG